MQHFFIKRDPRANADDYRAKGSCKRKPVTTRLSNHP
jgi:hypothetical protein